MDYLLAAMIIVGLMVILALLAMMVVGAVVLAIVTVVTGWFIWRLLPQRTTRWLLGQRSPVDLLTDHYVAGHIDIEEFERRLGRVLVRR